MNPKHHKEFRKDIAKEVNVHEDVVNDFIDFYYTKLRKSLSDLAYPSVNVFGLGTFNIRKKKLTEAIRKNKSFLGNLEKNTYDGYAKHIPVKEKLKTMEDVMSEIKNIEEVKAEFKKNKKK